MVKVKNPVEIEFYDVKTRDRFSTKKYTVEKKTAKGVDRFFVVAQSPNGKHQCWKIIGKDTLAILTKVGKSKK